MGLAGRGRVQLGWMLRVDLCDVCPLLRSRKYVTLNNTVEWEAKGDHDTGVDGALGSEEGKGKRRNGRRMREREVGGYNQGDGQYQVGVEKFPLNDEKEW